MKHTPKVTIIILSMFIITQIIGLLVIHAYTPKTKTVFVNGTAKNVTIKPELPYGMQPPEEIEPRTSLVSILFAFAVAIFLLLALMKIRAELVIKIWFFFVISIAIAISLNAFFLDSWFSKFIALFIAVPLAFFKVFKPKIFIHNLTEFLIYPGIAAVFVPLLSPFTAIALLVLISAYDVYAVWYSGFMQKLAKFQIKQLRVFAGFFVPYLTPRQLKRLKAERTQLKTGKLKTRRIRVSLAILGGGDIVFPIIVAGVMLRAYGLYAALPVTLLATVALGFLLFFSKKGEFYPAMPFISIGCLTGIIASLLIF